MSVAHASSLVHEEKAKQILRSVYGYLEFRGQQLEIITAVTLGQDCLVLMPTGGGKSICYQIPAQILPGVTLVVSPLIALMHDQVLALGQVGVRAALVNALGRRVGP